MELRCMCQVLLLLSASWTTVNSLECFGCEEEAECDQSPISCHGPDAYCKTSVLKASVFFLTALNIKKTCAYGERPDKVTQITAKQKVSLSFQENYCNTNFCNNETDFEPVPAEPNNLHCYGALCQGRQCASSTAMDNLMCVGNQTKCVELAISGKIGLTSDVSMKGCAEVPECEEEMGFRSTHASFHLQCCDSDFCNGGTGPTEDDLVPNGVECYSCSAGDEKIGCPLSRATTVNCTGSMTSCLEAYGVTRERDVVSSRVIRGCAAPKTCNGSFLSLLHQFQEPQVFCCSGNLCNRRTFIEMQNASHGVSNKPSSDGLSEHSSHVTSNSYIYSAANTANGSVVGTTSMEGKSNVTLSDNENILNSKSNMSITNYYEDSTAVMDSGTNSDLTQLEDQQDSGYDPQGQTDIQITDDLILSKQGMPLDDLDLNVSVSSMSSDLYQSGVDEDDYSTGGSENVVQSLKPSESNNSIFSNSSTGFLSGPPDIAISSDNGSASISGVSPGNKNNSVSNSSSVYHPGVNDTVLSSNDYNFAPNAGMALGGSNDLNSKNLSTVSPIASSTASPVTSAFNNTVSGSSISHHISEILTGGTNGSASFNSSMDYHNSSDHIGLSGITSPSLTPPGVTNNSFSPSSTVLYSSSDNTDVPTGNSGINSTSSDGYEVTTHTPISSAGDNSSAPLAGIYSGMHNVSLSSSNSTVYHNVTEHTTPSPGTHSTASFSAMSEDSHNVSGSNSYSVIYNNISGLSDHDTDTHNSTAYSGNIAGGNLLDSNNSTTVTPMSSTLSTVLSGNQTGVHNSTISSSVNDGSRVVISSMVYYNASNHTGHDSAASYASMSSGGPNDLSYNTSATHYYSGSDINIGNDSIAPSSGSNLSTTSYGESNQTTTTPSNHLLNITVPETIISYPHGSNGGFASTSPPTSIEMSTSHLGMSAGGTNDSAYNISSSDYSYSGSVMPLGGHNEGISNASSAIYHSDSEHAGLAYGDFKNYSLSGMPSVGHNDSLPNVSSIIYHSGSEHANLSAGDHSNGSRTGMPSVGHNDSISNTSSTMYHSDSENAYGDFKNVSGMSSEAHNDLLSNASSPIYHSGLEHSGLYTVELGNGSLPEILPGGGNDSVSDVISATVLSTGASSNDSLSVYPPGSHNDSLSNISSAVYHSDKDHAYGDFKNVSASGMPSEGHNDLLSNASSPIYYSDSEHGYGDFKNDSLSGMPSVGHNDSLPNVSSIIYHSGSEHASLSAGDHSNGSRTGMPSVGHNDSISNTSSTMYHSDSETAYGDHKNDSVPGMSSEGHNDLLSNASSPIYYSDSEHGYGDFRNYSVSGMPSEGHNDLISNASSPIYHSGSEHSGLYAIEHSNDSLPEVPPGGGNDSVSDVISATGLSTGAHSNDSLLVTPPGSHNNSLSNISSAVYHGDKEHAYGDFKNYSVSGMPSEGHNVLSNATSPIYHSDSEHSGLYGVVLSNSSLPEVPPGGGNDSVSNISSNIGASSVDYHKESLSGMPPEGHNDSLSNVSSTSYSEHHGLSTSDHSNSSLPGMTSTGHNGSDSNTSSTTYHSGSEHAGVTAVDYKNDSLAGISADRHNNSHFNISSEHTGLHSGEYKNDSFSGIPSEDHNYLLPNMSSNSGLASTDYNSDSLSGMLSEDRNVSLSNMSSNSGLSPGYYNSGSFLGMPPGGHNDSLSNISSTIYNTGSEHNGLSTVHNNNDSLSGVPSEGHNDSLTNVSSNIYHSGSEHTGISNTDHSNGSLPGMSLGGHNNSASNSSTLYHSSSEYYNFSIHGLDSALLAGAFARNPSSNSSLPVSHVNPNHTSMTSGHSSVSHSETTATSNNSSPLGYHTGANHTSISHGVNESSGSNMSASFLGASSDSFPNRNSSTMNTNAPHHESSPEISSTDYPSNVSMHNVSVETVSSSYFDSAVNTDILYRGDPNGTSGLTMTPTTTTKAGTGNNIYTTNSHPGRIVNTYVFLAVVILGLMY
ncbi:uncharacterized protein LOC144770762 [Lissotriton helveticus]